MTTSRKINNKLRPSSIIFDLDGTILDTIKDITKSVNLALAIHGLSPLAEDECSRFVGLGAEKLINSALKTRNAAQLDTLAVLGQFREIYAQHLADNTQPFPGVLPALEKLKLAGMPMAVLSNKPQKATTTCIQHFFPNIFDYGFGECPDFPRKPDPQGALILANLLNSTPQQTWFVGDSETDIQTARNAGMTSVVVGWGTRTVTELAELNPDYIINDPDELTVILQNS